MLRWQFLCYVLAALFFIKIALKLSYICKKMQNLRALGVPPPTPPCLRRLGALLPEPKTAPPPLRISGGAPDTWLVSENTHLLHYFLITIHKFTSTSPVFTHKILFKKISHGKCCLNKSLNFSKGSLGHLAKHALL